ncbi:MAG: isocitrate dehydrogenase kinase/phosphatase AceK regulatory subunit, partial [Bacteroidota bacterium]
MPTHDQIYEKLVPYDVAHIILGGYMLYHHQFKRITKRAKYRFEERNWHGIQEDARERINLYRDAVGGTKINIQQFLGDKATDINFWREVKRYYFEDIVNFNTRNIAETFYNSVYRHFHLGLGADKDLMFVHRTGSYREFKSTIPIFHTLFLTASVDMTIQQLFHFFKFDATFENLDRDIKQVADVLRDYFQKGALQA